MHRDTQNIGDAQPEYGRAKGDGVERELSLGIPVPRQGAVCSPRDCPGSQPPILGGTVRIA